MSCFFFVCKFFRKKIVPRLHGGYPWQKLVLSNDHIYRATSRSYVAICFRWISYLPTSFIKQTRLAWEAHLKILGWWFFTGRMDGLTKEPAASCSFTLKQWATSGEWTQNHRLQYLMVGTMTECALWSFFAAILAILHMTFLGAK